MAVLALFATLSPWLVRNYQTLHKPVFLKDYFWMEVSIGNVGNFSHWWNGTVNPAGIAAQEAEYPWVGEIAFMAEKRTEVLTFIRSHPGLYLWRCLR